MKKAVDFLFVLILIGVVLDGITTMILIDTQDISLESNEDIRTFFNLFGMFGVLMYFLGVMVLHYGAYKIILFFLEKTKFNIYSIGISTLFIGWRLYRYFYVLSNNLGLLWTFFK